jgi:flagellar basal body-associated protein FliL
MPAAAKVGSSSSGRSGFVPVILLLSLALGAWFWYARKTPATAEWSHAVKGSLHLETFVINLSDRDQKSYLRVGIDLGLGRDVGRGENPAPIGQVRDTILGVLAQSKVDDLLTAGGKEKLKQDLLHALQQRIPGLQVEEVYFTEFLIQR